MKLSWYPVFLDSDATPKVKTFIQKDLKKQPDLLLRVREFLKAIANVTDLDQYYKTEEISKVEGALLEMRIPPQRKGGVVRIYFCINPEDTQEIILLDAELKHKKKAMRTETAKRRLREFENYLMKRTEK